MRLKDYQYLKDNNENKKQENNILKSENKELEVKYKDNNYRIKKSKKDYNLEEIKEYVVNKCPVYYNPDIEKGKIKSKKTFKIILNYVVLYKEIINKSDNNIKKIEEEINNLIELILEENKCKNVKSNIYKYKQMFKRCLYLEEKYRNRLEYCNFNIHYIDSFNNKEWYIWLEYFNNLLLRV